MSTRVLITGSSGTLGKVLVRGLTAGGLPVIGMDIRNTIPPIRNGSFTFHRCSITDVEAMHDIFRREEPSHVFHLACSYNTIRNRAHEYNNDVRGSVNVLEASNAWPSVRQFVYFSSGAAYGGREDNEPWLTEDQPLRPGRYRYGLNKKLIEEKILKTELRPDLRKVILRLCTIVGPGYDKDGSVVSLLIKFPYMLKMCRDNILQFMHEEDMIELVRKVIDDSEIKGVFNLASDTAVAVTDLVPDKKYIHIPFPLLKMIFILLWNFRLLNLQPACLSYSRYPVIIDPSKLAGRYHYTFRYSSTEAFEDTKRKNMLDPLKKY